MPAPPPPPNPKTNPNPNPNPNRRAIFLGGNCLVAPNPKTNPDLAPNPNPNRDCPDTLLTAASDLLKQLQNTGEQPLLYWLFY